MNKIINKIYPVSKKNIHNSDGLYLKTVLSKLNIKKPIYYANFLTSFDGRIATFDKRIKKLLTPENIKNDIDFQLFCQLHAQADCLVTNTHYVKGLHEGYYGDILSIKNKKLNDWRKENNIKEQEIIILSNSLDFPIDKNLELYKEKIIILTTSKNLKKINELRDHKYKVIKYKEKNVSAVNLNKFILKKSYKSVYFIAGPRIVEQMISKNLLDRYYCSTSLQMLGTKNYDTIIRGDYLKKNVNLDLIEMYIHQEKKVKIQTIFQIFNIKGKRDVY